MGNDPYRASKVDGAGTTIHYMCEHYPKTGSLRGAADYSVANIDEHVQDAPVTTKYGAS